MKSSHAILLLHIPNIAVPTPQCVTLLVTHRCEVRGFTVLALVYITYTQTYTGSTGNEMIIRYFTSVITGHYNTLIYYT